MFRDLEHKAICDLEQAGGEAWFVGGCVRDAILGKPLQDIDICCSLPWQDTVRVLENRGWHVFPTGAQHGTITAVWPHTCSEHSEEDTCSDEKSTTENRPYYFAKAEITQYRTETSYSDGRHPDSVALAKSIEEDLKRRDFTINAMAYHPKRGLVDLYGGMQDIENQCIRAVGIPEKRFQEDALRLLRAARFSAQLGFEIHEGTFKAMEASTTLITNIASERLFKEFTLLLCGKYAGKTLMSCHALVFEIFPELQACWKHDQKSPYHCYDIYEHCVRSVDLVEASPLLRWATFLHDCGKPISYVEDEKGIGHFYGHAKQSERLCRQICSRLKIPRKLGQDLCTLVLEHDLTIAANPKAVKRVLRRLNGDIDLFMNLCALKKADSLTHAEGYRGRFEHAEALIQIANTILEQEQAFSLKHLAIKGRDLLELGFTPGPQISLAMQDAFEAVIDERIANTKEELLDYIASRNHIA